MVIGHMIELPTWILISKRFTQKILPRLASVVRCKNYYQKSLEILAMSTIVSIRIPCHSGLDPESIHTNPLAWMHACAGTTAGISRGLERLHPTKERMRRL